MTAIAPSPPTSPSVRATRARLRTAVADTLAVNGRNLLGYVRDAAAAHLLDDPAGHLRAAVPLRVRRRDPRRRYRLRRLPDARDLRPDRRVRRDGDGHRARRPTCTAASSSGSARCPSPVRRSSTGRTTADLCRNVVVIALMCVVGFAVGWRVHTDVISLRRRDAPDAGVRLRDVVDLRDHRTHRTRRRSGAGRVVPDPRAADLRVVGVRAGVVDAELAAGLRAEPAGLRGDDRGAGPDPRRRIDRGRIRSPSPGASVSSPSPRRSRSAVTAGPCEPPGATRPYRPLGFVACGSCGRVCAWVCAWACGGVFEPVGSGHGTHGGGLAAGRRGRRAPRRPRVRPGQRGGALDRAGKGRHLRPRDER